MRRTLISALVAIAVVAGCGDAEPTASTSSGSPALEAVDITGEAGEKPMLEFDAPFELDETATRIIEEGDGDQIADGTVITFDFVFVNGRNGEELGTSYGAAPQQLPFSDQLMTGLYKGLEGVPAGSQVLIGIPPADGLGADETRGVEEDDTLVFFADIHEVTTPLTRAKGAPVDPVDGLPTVALAEDGAPSITVPDGEPPAELVAQPLIVGEGAEVEAGQTITVHYTGVTWDDGTVFDSSWEGGSPATFGIGTGQVIPGWDEGLVGQAVGSQILLVVPPDKGYPDGSLDGSIPPGATIVFVVDILDAR